ncbi:PKD domain-containing protein [Phaeocystidibacter marisrubri]|uniref:PKD domain-containing protein n=1 Tax=Phaeocystidibacter marisrubri TaxID=1577780 RepID=A0A6L3ZEW4_9FLAO|nr:PKD domain-containing protein [Phaeocystidibacter marisrubri]KAB2816343.1 PKD domain-containing protein [Phaeocystidibacter marisrubri]GGH68554.1 hypothetical protein GCM10011318_08700 [Phaeocystidibacter marisrubri]
MQKALYTVVMAFFSTIAFAQYIVPHSGSDSSNACTGTLYDHGGATGGYSNGANGIFYITAPGSSLSMTFTAFQLESCCDYVRIYDGIGTTGALLLTANGTAIPNGGNPIVAPSGTATVRFTSDGSVVRSGFAMDWISSGGSTTPSVSFTTSTSNPPLNFPISFTNTSSTGDYSWDFGDGSTSTDKDPSHVYTASGTYTVQLTVTTCGGGTASSSQTVTVQGAPVYTVAPDSLYASVSCGGFAQGSFVISNDTSGTLGYSLTNYELPAPDPYIINEDFESGLGSFSVSPNAATGFGATNFTGVSPSGSKYLYLTGYTSTYEGLVNSFTPAQPNYFSYYVSVPYTSSYLGRTYLIQDPAYPYSPQLYSSYIRYGSLYVQTGTSTYAYPLNTSNWNQIEVININYTTHTYDLRINGAVVQTGLTFTHSTLTEVSALLISNTSSTPGISFDLIQLRDDNRPTPLTLSQTSGLLNAGNSVSVTASINTTGMIAGTYNYEVAIHTNSSGLDSLKTIPFVLDIQGASSMDLDQYCLNYGSQYTAITTTDSVEIINSGCDSLVISSITSTNADFVTSASALTVEPFDTAYLYVTFNPSAAGVYTDSIHLVSNAGDTAICLTATGLASAIGSLDSSAYNITSVGCNDSVHFNLEVINTGQAALNWDLQTSSQFMDDFNASTTPSALWQSIGTNLIGAHCYARSGNSLSMYGSNRSAITVPFDTYGSDSVSFWARPGFSSSPCERPDGGENLFVQYSTNGITWTTLGTIYNTYTTPTRYSYLIPVTGTVQIRLYQSSFTGSGNDHYLVDDFQISGQSGRFVFHPSTASTPANDTTQVQASVYVGDLVSGTYTYNVILSSNDPSQPILTFPVTLTIQGEPNMVVASSSCVDFGNVINGNVLTDSVLVYNDGCDSLHFSGVSSTNAEFVGTMSPSSIAAGDSAYLHITFTSTSIGTLSDTLTIQSNDSIAAICLTALGIGAPNFAVTPDSIYVSTNSCDDSLFVNLAVTNAGGLSPLTYQMDSIKGGATSALNVTVLKTYSDLNREYPPTLAALTTNLPNATITESTASTAAALTADLVNAHVLVIAEQENISSTIAATLAPAIQAFVNNGGSVVICGNSLSVVNGFGVMTASYANNTSGGLLTINNPSSPVFTGINTSAFYAYSATLYMNITNPGLEQLAYYSSSTYSVVSVHPYGSGKVGYYGFDFYSYDVQTQLGLANLVQYVAPNVGSVDWAYLTNDTATVASGATSNTGVHLFSAGLPNGRYTGVIQVNTNDPANAVVEIPVVFDVNGEASMRLSGGCLDFDSLIVGLQKIDTTTVYNDGCDTLVITGTNSSTGDYAFQGTLPLHIAPGDSLDVEVVFTPTAMGNRDDTLWVYASSDTLPLCVNGLGLGAPQLSVQSDSLVVELNKCDNFVLETYDLTNTGAGSLTYEVIFGDYYADTSYQTFASSGAVTNHSFTGTPATADSIVVTVITVGDYEQSYEYYNLYVEGSYLATTNGRTSTFGQPDTVSFVFVNPTQSLGTWLADGTLDVDVYNNSSVGYYSTLPNSVEVQVEIYSSAMPPWLTFPSTSTGTLAVGATDTKSLLFNATVVPAGTYTIDMIVLSNDPVTPRKVVPVIFDVREEPSIRLSDTCLSFPITQVGDTSSATIWVVNDGCVALNVTSITSASNVFKVNPTVFSVPAKDSVQVTVDFVPTSISNYSSSITVNSNAGIETFCVNGSANATPIADFQYNIIDPCSGQVYFSDHSTRNPTAFSWEFGDGTISNIQNPVHDYEKPGTYAVRLTASNSYGWDTITQYVTVNPLYVGFEIEMNGSLVTNDTLYKNTLIQFLDSSLTGSTWKWYLGDGTVSTLQNPTHTYSSVGNFQISLEVEDTAGCKDTYVKSYWIISGIGVDESLAGSLQLYPNPSSGFFTVDWSATSFSRVQIDLLDSRGAVLYHTDATGENRLDLDLSHLPDAMYILRVTNEDGRVVHERLIKQ